MKIMDKQIKHVEGFAQCARRAAAEGMVLLKNDLETLPVKKEETISVFGRCQIDYYRSGTGSGGSVNVPYKVNAIDGLRNHPDITINETLAQAYNTFEEENPFDDGGGGWAAEPWFQQEMILTNELVSEAKKNSDKAIIIIGRTAGEEQDNKNTAGSYLLTDKEKQMITTVTNHFTQTVVVLNVSNIIDMSFLDAPYKNPITGVLYAWHGGIEGGNALADILSGKVTPSGKMTDTIAYKLEDYPSHANFGDEDKNYYEEDIYVGYRYFETFNRDAVRYAFGYGLSYTSFDIKCHQVNTLGEGLETVFDLSFTVENTGSYKGAEVVQVYFSAPQGLLGKPALELGGFTKTKVLKPGEIAEVNIQIPLKRLASYDDGNLLGMGYAYVLEAGAYELSFGNSSRNRKVITIDNNDSYHVEETLLVELLTQAAAPQEAFRRIKPGKLNANNLYEIEYEAVPESKVDMAARINDNQPKTIEMTKDQGYKLLDVKEGKCSMETFIAQLSQDELEIIVRGEGMSSPKVTPGTAGAFGGVSDTLQYFGIPIACAADGPSGIRMDSGHQAMQVPIGTLLACSWDTDLLEDLYTYEGQELLLNQVDTLLGPGMNIHRHPLNGRNFEYFSEDPYITGEMAKAIVSGIDKNGSTTTIKHYACNDQEHERRKVDSVISERALREIHIKGFETAVKESPVKSIMTAYNPINGIWAASNYDLNTTILRGEWAYTGIVMSDWWAMMNHPVTGGEATTKQLASMVKAQNDIFMLVNNGGAAVNSTNDDLSQAVEEGYLSIGELQRSAMNICQFILEAIVISRPIEKPEIKAIQALKDSDLSDTGLDNIIVPLKTATDTQYKFHVSSHGTYSIITEVSYEQFESAQSACSMKMNDQYVTTIQVNGTKGNLVKEKNISVELFPGDYVIDISFTKPGLVISTIEFRLGRTIE